VRDVLRESLKRTVTAQVGALLSRRAFNEFRHRLDYREYGGATLLGVRGVCIIGHGSSNDRAIFNGIRVAYESAKAGTIQKIETEFAIRPKLSVAGAGAKIPAEPASNPGSNPGSTIQ
jgi:glycerol-3-phosphate acyltransferase PlsX